jgi:hypothetical protein
VFPGSTHPSGEPVEWAEDGEPRTGEAAKLVAAGGRLAAAALLLRARPETPRHDYLLVRRVGAVKERHDV